MDGSSLIGNARFVRGWHTDFGALARRGFGLAALQDPRAASLLSIPPEEMLREMRVLTTEGALYGGANAILFLAGRIWWAWPVYFAGRLPGCDWLLDAGYRWLAAHRRCSRQGCKQGCELEAKSQNLG
jgi:predicted DCC family thiol-disulfide oxidoreductase YuxK